MKFFIRLKELMKRDNITAYRLSKEISVHQTTIKNWLEDGSAPNVSVLIAIADFFDTTTDYLLGLTDNPIKPVETKGDTVEGVAGRVGETIAPFFKELETNKELKKHWHLQNSPEVFADGIVLAAKYAVGRCEFAFDEPIRFAADPKAEHIDLGLITMYIGRGKLHEDNMVSDSAKITETVHIEKINQPDE